MVPISIKKNKYGKTALMYAYESGNESMVKFLIRHGANINKKNKKERNIAIQCM